MGEHPLRLAAGMTLGDDHPIALSLRERFPDVYICGIQFRGDLSVYIHPRGLLEICNFLKNDAEMDFDYLVNLCSVDDPAEAERFEVIYELLSIRKRHQVRLKARIPERGAAMDSVVSVWKGANFLEREVFDMMGIRFNGHPDLRRILLPDDYDEGYPLRKDFPVEGRGWRDTFNDFLKT